MMIHLSRSILLACALLVATARGAAQQGQWREMHKVEAKETLYGIARSYGLTVDELRRRGMVSGGSPRAVVRQVDGMGRVTLPPKLREQFGLEHGSRVELIQYRDGVFVRPLQEEV